MNWYQLPIPHSGQILTVRRMQNVAITGIHRGLNHWDLTVLYSVSHCDKWMHLSKPVNMEVSNICILHHIFHQHQHQGNPDKRAPTWCQLDQPVGCGPPLTNAASHSLQGAGSSAINTACVDMLQSLTTDLHKALRSYPSPCHKMGLAHEHHHKCKQDF